MCISPYRDEKGKEFPCGRCMPCRIARTKEWKTRIMHEMQYWDNNGLFVTLTYAQEHLPEKNTLVKYDIQTFKKRVRKQLAKEGRKIKTFDVGEYGTLSERSHYHMLIMGMSSKMRPHPKWNHRMWRPDIELIKKCWQKGFSQARGILSNDETSISYVTGYIRKKLNGPAGKEAYDATGRIAPYMTCSQGIGKQWALDNRADLEKNLGILKYCRTKKAIYIGDNTYSYRDQMERKNIGMPRYYKKILEIPSERFEQKKFEYEQELLKTFKASGVAVDIEALKNLKVTDEMIPLYINYYKRYGKLPQVKEAMDVYRQQKWENKQAQINHKMRMKSGRTCHV